MTDIIVVGAGSAGCAIAARASENPNLSVLLIEAGPDYPTLTDTPADLRNGHNNSYRAHDWGFKHIPTAPRQAQPVPFPRGRVVGGSSAVNTCIALRGMPEDYDEWAELGNPAWAWDQVLPAFRRLERDLDYPDRDFHGDSGPISIRRYPTAELLPAHQAFLQVADDLGYPSCADANDPNGWGAGPQPMNKLGRLRVSCAVGYLAPARLRDNLEIAAEQLVRRLLIEGGRCVGVELEDVEGVVSERRAELVVLAAGALLSPGILLRSGIGGRAAVAALGVDAVCDLPGVGQNLCDHPAISVVASVRDPGLIDFDSPIIQTILRYTCEGSDKRNDLQIEQLSFVGRASDPPSIGIAAVLEYQYGRGELRLPDANPHSAPIVEQRFCEDERDAKRLARGLRDAIEFTRRGALADLIDEVRYPRDATQRSDAELIELCQRYAGSGYHPCGTIKMGPSQDAMAVVDQRGRVRGVDGLVVGDASIMPFVPRANTNLTSIMIGEKIGEWLRTEPAKYGLQGAPQSTQNQQVH